MDASGGNDGFVYVNVTDIYSVLGHYLGQNDDIVLVYDVSGPSQSTNEEYLFTSTSVLKTLSGTPSIKTSQQSITIPGVEIPAPAGGGVGIPPKKFADIVKEYSYSRFVAANMIEINASYYIIDTGKKGMQDIRAMIYIPADGELDTSSMVLRMYHSSTDFWEDLQIDRDFIVIDNGVKMIGEKKFREYLIKKKSSGTLYEEKWNLYNNDKISISYRASIPFGTHWILTRLFGYNYYDDKIIFEDIYTMVRREGRIEKLKVTESDWEMEKAVIGEPVVWRKTIEVQNPNNLTIEEVYPLEVFPDVLSVNQIEYEDGERTVTPLKLRMGEHVYVNWIARVEGLKTKVYVIEAITPPVIKIKETLDIIESDERTVTFAMNITFENFAQEDYYKVHFIFPVERKKIISLQGDFSDVVETGNHTEIVFLNFTSGESKNIYIIYRETPPILVTSVSALEYKCSETANITIFVVPTENESNSYVEFEIIGPVPRLKTAFADIKTIGNVRKWTEIKIPVQLDLTAFPSGKYIIYTKFKKDFGTILSDKKEFVVDCPVQVIIIDWVIFLVFCVIIVILLVVRIYRRKEYREEIAELRKKIEELRGSV